MKARIDESLKTIVLEDNKANTVSSNFFTDYRVDEIPNTDKKIINLWIGEEIASILYDVTEVIITKETTAMEKIDELEKQKAELIEEFQKNRDSMYKKYESINKEINKLIPDAGIELSGEN